MTERYIERLLAEEADEAKVWEAIEEYSRGGEQMTDYAKLADKLRSFATLTEVDFAPTKYRAEQRAAVMREAADAIDKLSALEA